MEYDFWESSPGRSPVTDDIEMLAQKDALSAKILYEKLERLQKFSYSQLRQSGIIEKIKGSRFKVHEFRLDLLKKICRIYCVPANTKLHLLHFVIKKSNKLLPSDINIAEERAKLL